jgi:tetratricopeptide (TPR) repeat protein
LNKCNECRHEIQPDYDFCIFCGTDQTIPQANHRKIRLLFFLTPTLLVILAALMFKNLGISNPIAASSALCTDLLLAYLLSAAFFTAFKFFGKFYSLPISYWEAAIAGLVLVFFSPIFSNQMLNMQFGVITENLTPDFFLSQKAAMDLYLMLFFIVLGAFSVALKLNLHKYVYFTDEESRTNSFAYRLFSNPLLRLGVNALPLLVCLTFIVFALGISTVEGPETQEALKAQVLKDYGLVNQALESLENSLINHPGSASLNYLYALFSIDSDFPKNNQEKALTLLEKAHEKHPEALSIKYYLSTIYEIKGNKAKTIQYALQATNKAPDSGFLNNYLGELYLNFNEPEQAVEAFKKALEANPYNAITMNNLSYVLLELDMEKVTALELAKNSVKLLPNKIFNKDTLAWAYYKNQRYTEALEEMNKIRDSIEQSDEINFHYIMILHSMSLIKNPIESIDKLLASPEVIMNNMLFRSITAARADLTDKMSNE